MKKYTVGVLIGAFLLPQAAFAAPNAVGLEFLSPLVQTIIGLLHERIAVLSAEVENLEHKLANVPSCAPLGNTLTPQQKSDEIDRLQAERIRADFTRRIGEIENKIIEQQQIIRSVQEERSRRGTAITAYETQVLDERQEAAESVIADLQFEISKLKIERNKQLSFVE